MRRLAVGLAPSRARSTATVDSSDAARIARKELRALLRQALREAGPERGFQRTPRGRFRSSTSANASSMQHHAESSTAESFDRALRLYDAGVLAGLGVHDRETTSLLVSACCLRGSPWEELQLPRALGLLERTWSVDAVDPRSRLDAADGATGRLAVGAPPRCAHPGCDAVASYGSAVDGVARSCAEHRLDSERRVGLHTSALRSLADGCVERGGMLRYTARVFEYELRREPYDWAAPAADEILYALTRLFSACQRARAVPEEVLRLVPRLLGQASDGASTPAAAQEEDEEAAAAAAAASHAASPAARHAMLRTCLNALLFACSAATMPGAAAELDAESQRRGVAPDLYSVNALVSAYGRAGELERAEAEVARAATRHGLRAELDTHVLASLLHACAVRGDAARAQQIYDATRQTQPPVKPSRSMLNALCSAHAKAGDVAAAMRAFDEGRQLGTAAEGAEGAEGAAGAEGASLEAAAAAEKEARDDDAAVSALLSACVSAQSPARAVRLFEDVTLDGYTPSSAAPYVQLMKACVNEPRHAIRLWEAAVAGGLAPTTPMLTALVASRARARDVRGAFAALDLGETEGVVPDNGTFLALLHVSVLAAEAEAARRAVTLAAQHGVRLSDTARNLQLAATLAALGAPETPAQRRAELLAQATRLYDAGVERGWEWQFSTRRWLLRACAEHDELPMALKLLGEMEARGEELDYVPLSDLVHACHRAGEIDDEALRLWKEGGTPALAAGAVASPALLGDDGWEPRDDDGSEADPRAA